MGKRHSMQAMRTPAETMALMVRETRLRAGPIPKSLGKNDNPDRLWNFLDGQFVLRTGTGYAFHYVPGEGVVVDRSPEADPQEQDLWLNGSVYAAAACLNGLYPVHASAVALDGRVHAFTGPSGAGKSTLVAGLGQRGLPLFCDDTLLLDLSDPGHVIALPGHKRLKLTDSALELTGAAAIEPVGSDTAKSYAAPPAGDVRAPMELASLTFLASPDSPSGPAALEPITGAARFAVLEDDHYTQLLYLEAQRPSHAALFELRARLAGALRMARLIRPFSPEGFAKSLDLAETAIREFS